MNAYQYLLESLPLQAKTWLITGVAGFIGSNLLEALLKLDQRVVGLDNFATGHQRNLDEVRALVTPEQWARFQFIEGDIRDLDMCRQAMRFTSSHATVEGERGAILHGTYEEANSVDYVLHQAALGSVPRSLENPINTNSTNIDGFLNMLVAARDAGVKSFTYAASSSTYGDHPALPKIEDRIGKPMSPYAVTKYVNELYADVFAQSYGFKTIGLRYFNVFGKRQTPDGAYAAVVPKWVGSMIRGEDVFINGDGETSRDFCFIENAIQANLLAATISEPVPLGRGEEGQGARNQVYNVAVGGRTNLNTLFKAIQTSLKALGVTYERPPIYRDFRAGDVRHSQADISKARALLGYEPAYEIGAGIEKTMPWYVHC